MTTILQINSAARSQGANSTLLVNELTAKLQQSNPGAQVVVRNLQAEPLPHLDDAILGAFFTPADQRTPEQAAIAARSEALIAELQAADIIADRILDPGAWLENSHVGATHGAVRMETPGVGTVYAARTPGAAGLQEDTLSPSPDVGQHSREVLRDHGYDEDAVNALIAGGAVRGVSS